MCIGRRDTLQNNWGKQLFIWQLLCVFPFSNCIQILHVFNVILKLDERRENSITQSKMKSDNQ